MRFIAAIVCLLISCSTLSFISKPIDHSKINYIRDEHNRIVFYHGVNHSNYSKHSSDNLPWHNGKAYDSLVDWGFNLVRFQVFWSAIEPTRDQFNKEYLDGVVCHLKELEKRNIDVVIDWHQDIYTERFSGNGFPEWTVINKTIPFNEQEPWHENYKEPAVIAAFTHFWWNTDGIQDRCVDAIHNTLDYLLNNCSNIIGIDPINEPFPGAFLTTFEKSNLPEYYNKIQNMLLSYNYDIMLFFEPSILSNNKKSDLSLTLKVPVAYFPHYYDAVTDYGLKGDYSEVNWRVMKETIEIKVLEAQELNVPLIFGEFGMAPSVKGYLKFYDDITYLASKYNFGWCVWSYDMEQYSSMGLIDNDGKERLHTSILVNVYAQRIAGNNPKIRYKDKSFTLEYETDKYINQPTIIFIPKQFGKIKIETSSYTKVFNANGIFTHINSKNEIERIKITW